MTKHYNSIRFSKIISRAFLFALFVFNIPKVSIAQTYSYLANFQPNPGGNPNGLNTQTDSNTFGWTQVAPGNQSNNFWSNAQTLPVNFNFLFFNQPVTSFRASQNGLITFDAATSILPDNNENLPSAALPPQVVACFWDQATPIPPTPLTSRIWTRSFGSAPNRQIWIKWVNFQYGAPGTVTNSANFACVLEETTNKIYLVDARFGNGIENISATVGLQNSPTESKQYGNDLTQFGNGNNTYNDNAYYEFTPLTVFSNNLKLSRILSPDTLCGTTIGETFTVEIVNLGQNNVTQFTANYKLNNGTVVTETVNSNLALFDTLIYTFQTPENLIAPDTNLLSVWINLPNDGNLSNDSIIDYRIFRKIPLTQTFINFESYANNLSVLDSLSIISTPTVNIKVEDTGLANGYALKHSGAVSASGWTAPSNGNEWTINEAFSAKSEFCIDANAFSILRLKFDLRQTFSDDASSSNFRILVNNIQVNSTYLPQTASSDPFQTILVDLTSFANGLIHLVFETRNRLSADQAFIDNIRVFVPSPNDLEIIELVSPEQVVCGVAQQEFALKVANIGTSPQTGFTVSTIISGGFTGTLNYTHLGIMAPGDTTVLLIGQKNTLNGGILNLVVNLNVNNDADLTNNGLTKSITVKPSTVYNIQPAETTICGAQNVYIFDPNIPSNYDLLWYDQPNDGNLLAVGSVLATPVLSDTVVYYKAVRETQLKNVGKASILPGTQSASSQFSNGLVFDVFESCRLDRLRVYPNSSGTVQIRLLNSSGAVLATKSVFLPTAVNDTLLFVGFELTPGLNYKLDAVGSLISNLDYNETGASYPYQIADILSIKGNSFGDPDVYLYFYDWRVITRKCPSSRKTYTVNIIENAPQISFPLIIDACEPVTLTVGPAGQFNYLWSNGSTSNTITVSQSGTYWAKASNGQGCVSIDTVKVHFPALSQINFPAQFNFCGSGIANAYQANASSYLWSNGATSSSLQFTQNVTSAWVRVTNNCGESVSDTFKVNIENGAIVDLGADVQLCANNIYVLNAQQNGLFTYEWHSTAFAPGFTLSSPNITVTAPGGKYWVNVTKPGGCTSSDTVNVNFFPEPTVNLGSNINSCGAVELNAGNPGATYLWSNGATTQKIDVQQSGVYSVIVTTAPNCSASGSVSVTVSPNFTVNLGSDEPVCADFKVLNATTNGATYLWNTGASSSQILVTQSGLYWVKVKKNGCTLIDSINVVLASTPTLNLGADFSACGSATLSAGSPVYSYLWSNGQTTPELTITQSGSYWVQLTNTCGGVLRDTIQVFINQFPIANAGENVSVCDQATLSANNGANFTYLWSNGETTREIQVSESGDYTVVVTNANGCSASDVVNATIIATPHATILLPDTFFVNKTLSATATVDAFADSYIWNFGAGAQPTSANGAGAKLFQYSSLGAKTVSLTVKNGDCSSTTTKKVVIVEVPTPVSISEINSELSFNLWPNPTNGIFRIETNQTQAVDIEIFTVSGQLVYMSKLENGNGEINTNELALGVYFVRCRTERSVGTTRLVIH